jgi:hypothetical protein
LLEVEFFLLIVEQHHQMFQPIEADQKAHLNVSPPKSYKYSGNTGDMYEREHVPETSNVG